MKHPIATPATAPPSSPDFPAPPAGSVVEDGDVEIEEGVVYPLVELMDTKADVEVADVEGATPVFESYVEVPMTKCMPSESALIS